MTDLCTHCGGDGRLELYEYETAYHGRWVPRSAKLHSDCVALFEQENGIISSTRAASPTAVAPQIEVIPPRPLRWSAIGRAAVGLAIVFTGAFIAYTSMRASASFGRSITFDPVAGDVYSNLSVAAEILACLLPTGITFYLRSGERFTALRGSPLMAIALTVVFFAAGGFAVTNLNAGVEARAERSTTETSLAQRRLDTITRSRLAECAKRGDRCRKLESETLRRLPIPARPRSASVPPISTWSRPARWWRSACSPGCSAALEWG
jgi:hypothetical protein